jgi:signal transduction histidine kinase
MSRTAGSGEVDGDRAITLLLKEIARDIAHELRGPVQSVVVNLEVLRRRAAKGQMEDVESRAAILEQEVRRLHGLADAFVGLLREPSAGPSTMPAETMLAVAEPIIDVIARSRHVTLERRDPAPGTLVRVRAEPAALALIRLVLALCDAAGDRATLIMECDTAPDTFIVGLELRPAEGDHGEAVAEAARENATRALDAANAWLGDVGGTASVEPGSDMVRVRVRVNVPRAT